METYKWKWMALDALGRINNVDCDKKISQCHISYRVHLSSVSAHSTHFDAILRRLRSSLKT